ncbi:hypothetical protein KUV50_17920 [Membranicola marinus]|uniref:Antitoxin n=1 Tax=Membranihabitans marinus TaxID=1227546 RepID=A0A953HRQ3_9BACT|nr:DUF6364 family protein [Membranihabitans marinus]MBY5960034.1 hypothetical protein [Membranihabitans marinus]
MSKLTLSIQQDIIDDAKKYAKSKGKSLSGIVETYLKTLTQGDKFDKEKTPREIINELRGSVKFPEEFTSYKDLWTMH